MMGNGNAYGRDKDRPVAPIAAPSTPTTTTTSGAPDGVSRGRNMTPGTPRGPISGSMLPANASQNARDALAAIAARRAARAATPTAPVAAPSTPTSVGVTLPSQASAIARAKLKALGPGSQVMENGRAFKRGGMVGCSWSPKSGKTMRGAARKGK